MSVETLITDVEAALARLLRLGLLARYQPVADLTGLAATVGPSDGALRWVTAASALFEWQPYVTTAANGSTIIASASASVPNGRWSKVVTTWTMGAGGPNLGTASPLRDPVTQATIPTYLAAVETYSSTDGPDAALDKVFGQTPSVLIQFRGSAPKSDSNLPGTFYKDDLRFLLIIISENLSPAPAATQGSRVAGTVDPGAYRIIGNLRRLLCGVSPDFGVAEVERVEIGDVDLFRETDDRRLQIWTMDILCRTSWHIQDEDLVDYSIYAQPELTDCSPALVFDKDNFVASGCGLVEGLGTGFARTVEAGIAMIGGVAVASADTSHTFTADSDTYRDLSAAGAWTFTAVAVYDDQPALASGSLRVAITRTDDTGVVSDTALCSYSIPFGAAIPVA